MGTHTSTRMPMIPQDILNFFHACESGKGWKECSQYCASTTNFTCQATDSLPGPAITSCNSVEDYTEWMAGVCANMGEQASYAVEAKAFDEDSQNTLIFATFGGFSHYVYLIHNNGEGKVDAVTKCWNDAHALEVMSGKIAPAAVAQAEMEADIERVAASYTNAPEAATALFDACESGKGWTECSQYCASTTNFTCQATDSLPGPAITSCNSVEDYTEWMAGVCANMGEQASYAVEAKAFDEETQNTLIFATFGGFSHYVYLIHTDGEGKVDAMTKCWNDAHAFEVMSGKISPAA